MTEMASVTAANDDFSSPLTGEAGRGCRKSLQAVEAAFLATRPTLSRGAHRAGLAPRGGFRGRRLRITA